MSEDRQDKSRSKTKRSPNKISEGIYCPDFALVAINYVMHIHSNLVLIMKTKSLYK